jgi:tetratricopeptide repeat protein 21B
LLKRAGRVKDLLPRYLRAAVREHSGAESTAGYRFITGLQHRALNNPAEAVKAFNSVRAGGGGGSVGVDWAQLAVVEMLKIYLSPDGDSLWKLESIVPPDMLAVAAKLIEGASPAVSSTSQWEVLRCQTLIASRNAGKCDEAISRLALLLEADPNYIPAIYALSIAFMVTSQAPKARNQLKRLLKLPTAGAGEWAEESVGAWLMLSDIYAESGKPDQATEAIQRALQLDASAGRAWEYLGTLAEKELRYADAADAYERAWMCEGEASAPVGYKLAFNYLKAGEQSRERESRLFTERKSNLPPPSLAGRSTSAIDVAKKVLKDFPEYKKIKSDVIDKARALVRTEVAMV